MKYTEWNQSGVIATIGIFNFQNSSTNTDKSWCSVSACRTDSQFFTSLGFPPVAPPQPYLVTSMWGYVLLLFLMHQRTNCEARNVRRTDSEGCHNSKIGVCCRWKAFQMTGRSSHSHWHGCAIVARLVERNVYLPSYCTIKVKYNRNRRRCCRRRRLRQFCTPSGLTWSCVHVNLLRRAHFRSCRSVCPIL